MNTTELFDDVCEQAQHWNHHLPTPKVPLKVQLESGEVMKAIRPNYISDRNADDQGYRDEYGEVIYDVKGWVYDV